jgi:hypothetical protein
MSVSVERGAFGFGSSAAASAGQAVGGLGAFSQAAYRQADEIRRSIALPPANLGAGPATGSPAGGATLGAALAGFIASPAGHAALERLASAGTGWLERALGVAGAVEQLALPLA